MSRALHLAKVTGATLVIARLDRLSRNAAFLLALRDSGVRFLACDMPQANDLTVGVMALVAEAEREAISRRTKEALAAARSRGVRLGNPFQHGLDVRHLPGPAAPCPDASRGEFGGDGPERCCTAGPDVRDDGRKVSGEAVGIGGYGGAQGGPALAGPPQAGRTVRVAVLGDS